MDIWLLRHAAAEEVSTTGRDADRELTPDGARRAERVARGLAALEPAIDLVLTSPYRRARQTAERAARALGLEKNLRETRALEPGRDPRDILEELRAEQGAGVLLVGHEPQLGTLLGILVAGGQAAFPLKKAMAAWVAAEGGEGTLKALLPARVLERVR
ncbi:MAG: phosphohistidine phosphatase SixA [Thermoanaerobaculia bacterium]